MKVTQLSFLENGEKIYDIPKLPIVRKTLPGFSDTSFIIYEGPSEFDGKPIVVVASGFGKGKSHNEKTGAMIQTWIIRQDESPIVAHANGNDKSICGDCKHRRVDGFNSCYVNLGQGPRAIYETYKAGRYMKVMESDLEARFANQIVRLGSYGDPMAVPLKIWEKVLGSAKSHTGYTHQWNKVVSGFFGWQEILMASADSVYERESANIMGWRTFRVKTPYQETQGFEISCPASEEAGRKTNCDKCGLCAGTSKRAKNIAINAHGIMKGIFILETHQMTLPGIPSLWK